MTAVSELRHYLRTGMLSQLINTPVGTPSKTSPPHEVLFYLQVKIAIK